MVNVTFSGVTKRYDDGFEAVNIGSVALDTRATEFSVTPQYPV